MNNEKKIITSLARGLQVLSSLSEEKTPLTLTELSEITGLNKVTLGRYIFTLLELGYLEQIDNKKYRIGSKVFSLGYRVIKNYSIQELYGPSLKELSEKTKQTVTLSVLGDKELIIIQRYESSKILDYDLRVGSMMPLHCTAGGKAMLAFLEKEKINSIVNQLTFEKLTKYTITDRNIFLNELEQVMEKGYSLQNQEISLNSRSTGAPILLETGRPVATISLTVNASNYTIADVEESYSPLVAELSTNIALR